MARMRTIKPSFFTNDVLGSLPMGARLLFQGLWCVSDREGRVEDRPKKFKVEILPFDKVNIEALLDLLAEKGFIERYESGGTKYIQVVNFKKHQTPHIKESASTIPAPDEHCADPVPAPAHARAIWVVGSGEQEQEREPADAGAPPQKTHRKPRPFLTDEQRERLHARYDPTFGAEDVDERLKVAMGHVNAKKYGEGDDGWYPYANQWLKSDVERLNGRLPASRQQNPKPQSEPPGGRELLDPWKGIPGL